MIPFAIQVVLILLIVSGVIAYIGNYVGRYIGKRRLVLFNLRPRHTAILITILSGALIALVTLGTLLIISQDARTAFLGLEKLKSELKTKSLELTNANQELAAKLKQQAELEAGLTAAKSEIVQLGKTKTKLSREVTAARQGEMILKKGEIITLSLIQAGSEKTKIEGGLKKILSAADANLRSYGIKGNRPLVTVAADDFDQAVYELLGQNKVFVVKLVAVRNSFWNERVPARFELVENKLIFAEGSEITSSELPNLAQPEAEQAIMHQLGAARQAALEAGVLPDPAGSLGGVPYSQIADLAKKIKGQKVTLKIIAKKDIYTIGPLDVAFKVK